MALPGQLRPIKDGYSTGAGLTLAAFQDMSEISDSEYQVGLVNVGQRNSRR